MTVSKLDAALDCITKGWHIFPLKPDSKRPATRNGFKDASDDPDKVETWWNRNPDYNIGIATGEVSGIAVVDIDVKNGKRGEESLNELGLDSDTYVVRTASGGWHYYYHYEPGIGCHTNLMDGIDLRGDGGYVVGPGSTIGGDAYKVVCDA